MGISTVINFALISIFAIIGYKFYGAIQNVPPPVLEEVYWGPGEAKPDDPTIKPFKLNVSNKVLADLKYRLENHRPFTPPLEGIAQEYGMNSNLLSEIVEFWKTKYDWKEREKIFNKYNHFKTQIQGLDIHYVHVKPANPKGLRVLPLLMVHGWPGSVREFFEIIPMLTEKQEGKDFVFELILPSLPGYAFSQAAAKPGLGAAEIAVVFKNLMERLGFKKWYMQGGDWGSAVTSNLASLYGDKVLGLHLNLCHLDSTLAGFKLLLGSFYPRLYVEEKYENRMYPLSHYLYNLTLETGYGHIQATKPDTVGFGLNESPIGLAAYILEKFTTGTNRAYRNRVDGGLKLKFKYEDLLDNIMIYWITNSMTTAMRLYSETMNIKQKALMLNRVQVTVPTACAKFEHEIAYLPDNILQDKYPKLVHSANYDNAGHFAAFEVPDVLAKDIFIAVEKMQKA